MTPNVKGKIPLHYAAREGRTDMVNWFLTTVPETATFRSSKNKLALHFAAGDGHVEIVQALLRAFPEGARLPSAKGKLPLHFAARWGHVAIARELVRAYPAAVRALDWEGSLPLHDGAREGQADMARFLVEQYPQGLVTANLRSEIPLFPAVRSGSLDLLCYMVQTWPPGARHILRTATPQDWDWAAAPEIMELLLRGAVGNFAGCAVLRGRLAPRIHFLNDASVMDATALAMGEGPAALRRDSLNGTPTLAPGAAAMEAADLAEPLQQSLAPPVAATASTGITAVAVAVTATGTTVEPHVSSSSADNEAVAKKRPNSTTLDPTGRKRSMHKWRLVVHQARAFLPLHAALESGANVHVVHHVMDTFGGARRQDEQNRWPLHVALARCAAEDDDEDGLRMVALVRDHLIHPEAAMTREHRSNRLPLHIALDAQAHVSILERLLDVYPQAAVELCHTKDEWEKAMPIFRALQCDLSTLYRMLRVDPAIIQRLNSQHAKSSAR